MINTAVQKSPLLHLDQLTSVSFNKLQQNTEYGLIGLNMNTVYIKDHLMAKRGKWSVAILVL